MKESKYMNNEKEKQRIKGKHNNVKSKQNEKESKNNKKEKQKVKNVIPNNIKLNQKMKGNKNADKHEKQKMKDRTMNNRKEKQNILDGIIDQISSFDNKANILITAIGIAFSISLIFVERPYNSQLFKKIDYYNLYLIIFIIYIISSITAITFFILVVVPRTVKALYNKGFRVIFSAFVSEIGAFQGYPTHCVHTVQVRRWSKVWSEQIFTRTRAPNRESSSSFFLPIV